jgi:hypothetical protein
MKILQDKDPLPLYGLKLLSILVEKNPSLISLLKKINIVNLLYTYFERNITFNALSYALKPIITD